jgi:Sulfotransferase domain
MTGALRSAGLELRSVCRILVSAPLTRDRLRPLDDRFVFIVGSPRSGTSFLGRSIGSVPGLLDLGEVDSLKPAIRELAALDPSAAAPELRRLLTRARRLALVGSLRPVEQTPEVAHVVRAVTLAFPEARVVHALRDGRDVVCSLLEQGWLNEARRCPDGSPLGSRARFWVEPERREEFSRVSDARRAAWAWRRYVEAVRSSGVAVHEVRYERMVEDPDRVAAELASVLEVSLEPLAAALRHAHRSSVGRHADDLDAEQLEDVLAESGDLLEKLGYVRGV